MARRNASSSTIPALIDSSAPSRSSCRLRGSNAPMSPTAAMPSSSCRAARMPSQVSTMTITAITAGIQRLLRMPLTQLPTCSSASSGPTYDPASSSSTTESPPNVRNDSRNHRRNVACRFTVPRYRLKRWYSRRSLRIVRSTSSTSMTTSAIHSSGRVAAQFGSSMWSCCHGNV